MEIDPRDLDQSYTQTVSDEDDNERPTILQKEEKSYSSSLETDSTTTEHQPGRADLNFHQAKWERLRKHYSDEYLELFKASCIDDVVNDSSDLLDSRFGAVAWKSEEKKKLFAALARYGRHDLPLLAIAVETKSPVEIAAYIKTVAEAGVDRQLFMSNTKNVSLSEIPAALEIGSECDDMLTRASDALCAYQEQFDISAGQNAEGQDWLVDRSVALRLDGENELVEEGDFDNGEHEEQHDNTGDSKNNHGKYARLFKLSVSLKLCEQFFMNVSPDDDHEHWYEIAEPGQGPAMTKEVIQIMHVLVQEHVRKIIGIAIQTADVRLTQMTNIDYTPVQRIKQSDIEAALDVLGLPHDSWQFWASLPRRNRLHVITGSHSKGESRLRSITYDDAEAVLTPRKGRGRRRSMSIGSHTSSATGSPPSDGSMAFETTSDYRATESEHDTEDGEAESEAEANSTGDGNGFRPSKKSPTSSVTDAPSEAKPEPRMSSEYRRIRLEEAQEDYAERIDQAARVREEKNLWKLLGKRPRSTLKDDDDDDFIAGPRPKTLRKTQDELQGWLCNYEAEWEHHGRIEPSSDIPSQATVAQAEVGESEVQPSE